MSRWVIGKVLALLSVLGIPLTSALAQNSRQFETAASARTYLRNNPDGPEANAAFLALVEFRLISENPGLTRDQIIATSNQKASAAINVPQSQVQAPGLY
ncbi:hypothetical protein FMN50_11685 [Rhodobacterales bacterium]|nr:hypothetical protein FMN50_11685 [Rhodobacterales bacterium]